jgi:hypothetical protein
LRPGASGGVELTPFEFLDRLADLVPPPRKHRHRYYGVFPPNQKLTKNPSLQSSKASLGQWVSAIGWDSFSVFLLVLELSSLNFSLSPVASLSGLN